MANTFTLKSASYDGRYLELTCTQTQNISANTSTIAWTLAAKGGSSSYYSTGPTTVKINGEQAYYKARVSYSAQSFPAAKGSTSGSVTVKHNSDGSLTIPVSLTTAIYTTSTSTKSGNWELDKIPRSASITSAPNFNDEENPVIKYDNPAGSNVSTLQACIASTDGKTIYVAYRDISKTGSSYTFSLTAAERTILRNACTTAKSMSVKFYIKTIIGDNTFYSSVSKTLSIINAIPSLSPVIMDIGATSAVLTNDAYHKIIKGFNTIQIAFGATALKGATIKSQKVVCGDKSRTSDGNIDNVTSGEFVFTVTDSRGNTATKTVNQTLINYVAPTIGIKSGKLSTEGVLTFSYGGNAFGGSFGGTNNSVTVQYRYKESGGSYGSWTNLTAKITDNRFTASGSISGLDYQKSYTIQARIKDSIYSTDSQAVLSEQKTLTALPVFDWGASDFNFNVSVCMPNGKAIRGKLTDGSYRTMLYMNTNNVVSIGGGSNAPDAIRLATADNAGSIQVNGVELDYIVEQGTKNGWDYKKWNSGKAECWKIVEHTTAVSTAWGSMYMGTASSRQTYPFVFTAKPMEQATLQAGSYQGILFPEKDGNGVNGTNSSARYNICRPSSVASSTFYISLYVVGNWK